MAEDGEATPKKPKLEAIVMSPSQKIMIDRINEFNDAGMVIVQNHTFNKPDRVLWAMSTPLACDFYPQMPPNFIKQHPLLLKYNTLGTKPYDTGKYLTKCIGVTMGVYPKNKTQYVTVALVTLSPHCRRLLELFFFRTNTWKRIIPEPSTEGFYTAELLKTIFYKMVFVLMREDGTCALATEYIRTAFLVSQDEAKDLCPAKTTFFEVSEELQLPGKLLHTCSAPDCTCSHNTALVGTCTCNIAHITKLEVVIGKHTLHDVTKSDGSLRFLRTDEMMQDSLNILFNSVMLSNGFRKLRENMAIAMEQHWSDWNTLTGYGAVTTPGDTEPLHQKDWPLMHNCARILNMSTDAFRSCVHVEKYSSFTVNLVYGKHKLPRYLCYIARDSILYVAFMAHSQWHAAVGALRVLMYNIHFRAAWSVHHDPALSCVAGRFATYKNLGDFRKDYPYDAVN